MSRSLIRKEVLESPAYHLEEHEGVKLNQNESPWDLPIELKAQVIENLLKTPWNRYPLSDVVQLKKKMAKHLNVWPDNLVFANGSNVLIQALILATTVKGKMLVVDPSFSVYELEGKLLGNKVIRQPLNDDFSIPLDDCLHTIRKEKPSIIFIPNPNAPTGNLFAAETLKKIIEAAPGLVVIDEAYYPFSGETCIEWIKQYDHLVVLRTFSKAYALGGLRLGYLVAEPEIAQEIQKCLLPFCISKLTFTVAMTVLDEPDYINQYVTRICAERARVYSAMQSLAKLTVYPTNTNFILFEVENSKEVFNHLLQEGVIVRQVSDGRRLTQALRVTVGEKSENDLFLKALVKALG